MADKIITNGSRNNTEANDSNWSYIPIQPKQGLILFIIVFIGTTANFVAFLTTFKLAMKQRSAINYLIIALTTTDTYGIIFCALPTLLCYLQRQWIGGGAMCNFQGVSTMFASLASGSLATAMAVERLFAIWKPFLYREIATKAKTLLTIVVILSAAMIIALFPLVKEGNFVRNLTGTYCTINWFAKDKDNVAYAIFYAIMGVILLVIVLFCNINIAVRLIRVGKKRSLLRADSAQGHLITKKMDSESKEDGGKNGGRDEDEAAKVVLKSNSGVEMIERDQVKKTQANSLEKQLAKTVAVISVLFIICWTPFIVSPLKSIVVHNRITLMFNIQFQS